ASNQPLLPRPIAQTLRGTGVRFVQGRVTRINLEEREVIVEDQQGQVQRMAYLYLVYALGSLPDRQSVPGVADHSYTLAPSGPPPTTALREILPAVAGRNGQDIVCGSGPTGIETAAEFARTYQRLRVRLVSQGPFGLFLGPHVARDMRRSLEGLGVEVIDHTTVAAVRAESIVTDQGLAIPGDICLWAGGFVAPSLAREAGLLVNERGQIVIDPSMRSLSHPEIYAVGDAAHPREDPGVPVRMSALTAVIMGAHGADCLSAVLRGKQPKPLSFAYL